jgi:uncharacterized protein (TIGR00369 family)
MGAAITWPGDPAHPVFLPTYDACYVCGQSHPRGLRIRFFTDERRLVYAHFLPDQTQTGYDAVVHGGVISALLDELIGWSVYLHQDRFAYTAEVNVRFLRPLLAGQRYHASSRVGTGHGRIWEADGGLFDEAGRACATGHGKYYLLSPEQTADFARKLTYRPGDLRVFQPPR